jgi:hypothetical protein
LYLSSAEAHSQVSNVVIFSLSRSVRCHDTPDDDGGDDNNDDNDNDDDNDDSLTDKHQTLGY